MLNTPINNKDNIQQSVQRIQPISHASTGCLQLDRWDRLDTDVAEIKLGLLQIHDKLFVGNGNPALMVRVDRIEQFISVINWALALLVGGGLLAGVAAIISHVWKAIA